MISEIMVGPSSCHVGEMNNSRAAFRDIRDRSSGCSPRGRAVAAVAVVAVVAVVATEDVDGVLA